MRGPPACRRRLPRPLRPHGRGLPPALAGNRDDAARAAHPICFGGPCSRRFGFGLPAERRAVAPHGEQDHRQTPGHGDTGAVHAAPLGEAQPPALQRRRAPGAGEKRVGGLRWSCPVPTPSCSGHAPDCEQKPLVPGPVRTHFAPNRPSGLGVARWVAAPNAWRISHVLGQRARHNGASKEAARERVCRTLDVSPGCEADGGVCDRRGVHEVIAVRTLWPILSEPGSDRGLCQALGRRGRVRPRWVSRRTGSLSPWLHRGLCAAGLPALCIDARRVAAYAQNTGTFGGTLFRVGEFLGRNVQRPFTRGAQRHRQGRLRQHGRHQRRLHHQRQREVARQAHADGANADAAEFLMQVTAQMRAAIR